MHAWAYCFPGAEREYPRCRLFFVSILTYSLSSRDSSRSFCTAANTSPRICNAAARRTAVSRDIAGSFNTRSHVSRNTESISSFVPCQTRHAHTDVDQRNVGPKWGRTETYLEEGMKALFRGLFFETFLFFSTEVPRLFGLLYLVEYGLELNCRPQSRHAVERQCEKGRQAEAVLGTHVSENTWYLPCTLCNHPPTPKKL